MHGQWVPGASRILEAARSPPTLLRVGVIAVASKAIRDRMVMLNDGGLSLAGSGQQARLLIECRRLECCRLLEPDRSREQEFPVSWSQDCRYWKR
jgi:hypothetical protein